MRYTIEAQPSYSVLEVTVDPGEQLVSEAGAMAWMSPNMRIATSTRGGIMAALSRSMLSGESFFQNTYEAVEGPGVVGLTPGQPGDVVAHQMTGGELLLEKDAYLASDPGVRLDSNFQGLSGLFNEGLFVLRATGAGTLFFTGYGDIEEIDLDGEYLVDNGHAVAWDSELRYTLTRARKIRSFLFSDQLLMRFSGKGKLWVQSRNPRSFANWIVPFRPVEQERRR
ncbi:MAG: TIGR00266 family protein [Chloroflexi bacterium]|nr:TIGR00266 family protein [Chloroflexota bacterium]